MTQCQDEILGDLLELDASESHAQRINTLRLALRKEYDEVIALAISTELRRMEDSPVNAVLMEQV